MSVSAFDQLLRSAASKPSFSSSASSYTANTTSKTCRLDQALALHQRLLTQAKQQHHDKQQRKHSTRFKSKTKQLSPRSHAIRKSAMSHRSLLTALRVDEKLTQLELVAGVTSGNGSGFFCSDFKVKLFFDGLVNHAKTTTILARLPSSVKLFQRNKTRRSTTSSTTNADNASQMLVIHASVSPKHKKRHVQQQRDQELQHVERSRKRRSSQYKRRLSLSVVVDTGAAATVRSRRRSWSETTKPHDQEKYQRSQSAGQLLRTAMRRGSAAASSAAQQSNAQLSLALMERKWLTTAELVAMQTQQETQQETDDDHVTSTTTTTTATATEVDLRTQLETLRADHAEQKALIRQLLIENRRLQMQIPVVRSPAIKPVDDDNDQDASTSSRRDRGISTVSSSTTTDCSSGWNRRESLTFDVVNGEQTLVDHKFDHLVSEITWELAELLSEDCSSSSACIATENSSSQPAAIRQPSLLYLQHREMRGTYTGDLVDGIRQGSGRLVFANGDVYDGDFVGGFRHGHGIFTSERGTRRYEGEWRRSERHGRGKETWGRGSGSSSSHGDRYEGEYQHDLFHGKGILVRSSTGSRYDGEFASGRRHGRGRMEFASASSSTTSSTTSTTKTEKTERPSAVYDGEWRNGRMHGTGKYTRGDGSFYDGAWVDGLAHGFGKEVALVGEIYEGEWSHGRRHGDGAVVRNGKRRKGVWEMGARVKWTSAEMPLGGATGGGGGATKGGGAPIATKKMNFTTEV